MLICGMLDVVKLSGVDYMCLMCVYLSVGKYVVSCVCNVVLMFVGGILVDRLSWLLNSSCLCLFSWK